MNPVKLIDVYWLMFGDLLNHDYSTSTCVTFSEFPKNLQIYSLVASRCRIRYSSFTYFQFISKN